MCLFWGQAAAEWVKRYLRLANCVMTGSCCFRDTHYDLHDGRGRVWSQIYGDDKPSKNAWWRRTRTYLLLIKEQKDLHGRRPGIDAKAFMPG